MTMPSKTVERQVVGDPDSGVTVSLIASPGMITLRGDLASADLVNAIKATCGCQVPDRRRIEFAGERFAAWMSHDELLICAPASDVTQTITDLGHALAGNDVLVCDVSDARMIHSVSGTHMREVLAMGCPADLSREAFGPGDFIRTRLSQVAVGLWMREPDAIMLMCFRSFSGFVEDWLENAARGPFSGYLEP